MVDRQIAGRGVGDRRVLDAMRLVPRERFVRPGLEHLAYEDRPLPIGHGQTISQPFIVAYMAEAAQLGPTDRVLDVGAGSGYAAAVAACIAGEVFAIERHPVLGAKARLRLEDLGYDNVALRIGDGTRGWPEEAPFDAIIVAAGGRTAPPALKQQLGLGGRLIIPVGSERDAQRLLRIVRLSANDYKEEDLGGVMFVPLIGGEG